MTIPITNLQKKQMILEAENGVLNLQRAAHREPQLFKSWAQNEAMDAGEISGKINTWLMQISNMRDRLRHFRDVTIANDPSIVTLGETIGISVQDVDTVGQQVAAAIDAFAGMPRSTYAEIIAACDYLIGAVDEPPSVWQSPVQ